VVALSGTGAGTRRRGLSTAVARPWRAGPRPAYTELRASLARSGAHVPVDALDRLREFSHRLVRDGAPSETDRAGDG